MLLTVSQFLTHKCIVQREQMSLLNTPPVLSKNLSLSMIGNGIKGIGIMSSSISPQKKMRDFFLHTECMP
jgi:hypothetical protein